MGDQTPPRKSGDGPDPFHTSEAESWARNVGSAEPNHLAAPDSLQPSSSNIERDHVGGLDVVKTASQAVRRKLHLDSIRAGGPSRLFNPTNVRVHVRWDDHDQSSRGSSIPGQITTEQAFLWRSRDNRKGRNSIAVPTSPATTPSIPFSTRLRMGTPQVLKNILRMVTTFPYWDMAFWSGWSYSIGSILFIMDASWSWKDVAEPGTQIDGVVTYGAPLCFFIGALLYELGALMSYFEAINDGSFQGSAMRRFLEGNEEASKRMLDEKIHDFFGQFIPHRHHTDLEKNASAVDPEAGWRTKDRRERPGSIYHFGKRPAPRRGALDLGEAEDKAVGSMYTEWRWWPSWSALRTFHVYEIGFLACSIQLLGATLYAICGTVDLPGVFSQLAHWQAEGAFWVPQVVASVCFLTAAVFFTLETQEKWWRPEPTVIGWWIGIWAGVGSVGFLSVFSLISVRDWFGVNVLRTGSAASSARRLTTSSGQSTSPTSPACGVPRRICSVACSSGMRLSTSGRSRRCSTRPAR